VAKSWLVEELERVAANRWKEVGRMNGSSKNSKTGGKCDGEERVREGMVGRWERGGRGMKEEMKESGRGTMEVLKYIF
jgi:hypothetical protein